MSGVGAPTKGIPTLKTVWQAKVDDFVQSLEWSPDGRLLGAASVAGPISVFDAASGEECAQLSGHAMGTTSLSWRADGGCLASSGQDGVVRLWDTSLWTETARLDAGATWAEKAAWSPREAWLATAAGKTLRLWDANGSLVREYPAHPSTIADIAWKPESTRLASTAYSVVNIWSPERTEQLSRFEWKGSVLTLAWSPDGKYLATGDQDSTVHFWIVRSGRDLQMWGYEMKVRELAWDRTARYLATGGSSTIVVWDCSGRGPEGTKPQMLSYHEEPITTLAYQNQGKLLASGAYDGRVAIWEQRKEQPSARFAGPDRISHVRWSPDDRRLAIGDEGGAVVVLEAP